MHNTEKDAVRMAANRQKLMEMGYRLFVRRTIDGVSLEEVAKACKIGVATLYRYFGSKQDLVIAISVWKWEGFWKAYVKRNDEAPGLSAAQRFGFYLDAYPELYRSQPDLLRFNQFFNLYLQRVKPDRERTAPYERMIGGIAERFREIWDLGQQDHTVRTDIPWQKVFSATLHIMMAAASRYAVGLAYRPEKGTEPGEELAMLRDMLYRQYVKE